MRYNSQIKQDEFVDLVLDKDNGFFLDIGSGTGGIRSNDIGFFSNTYYFEKHRGWDGICLDYDNKHILQAQQEKKSTQVCCDLMKTNICEILSLHKCPKNIDYISFDVDDATEKALSEFDFDTYKFSVMTFEHNYFQALGTSSQKHTDSHKERVSQFFLKSRDIILSAGYFLMAGNVRLDGYGPVEDWWVSEEIFDLFNRNYLCFLRNEDVIENIRNRCK